MKTRTVLLLAVVVVGFSTQALAAPITYVTTLTGLAESPPNASPATGYAEVVVDPVAHTLQLDVTFADLCGFTTAAHIHCCAASPGTGTAGIATPIGVRLAPSRTRPWELAAPGI
jgi:hypothetical protein